MNELGIGDQAVWEVSGWSQRSRGCRFFWTVRSTLIEIIIFGEAK